MKAIPSEVPTAMDSLSGRKKLSANRSPDDTGAERTATTFFLYALHPATACSGDTLIHTSNGIRISTFSVKSFDISLKDSYHPKKADAN